MKEIEECKIIEKENLGTYQSSSGIAIKTIRATRKKDRLKTLLEENALVD